MPTPTGPTITPPTAEEIARHYSAMMDSVNLINSIAPATNANDVDTLDRNVRHLEQMLMNDWWTGYDLEPIEDAIVAGTPE
jgi:hypothetical protein